MIDALWAGLLVGFFVAVPPGPVTLACVRNAALGGTTVGLLSGLGAATAHGLFAFSASAGASALAGFMAYWQDPISVGSACLLIGLGCLRLRKPRRQWPLALGTAVNHRVAYLECLMLALSNPMTMLPYLAVATSLASAEPAVSHFGTAVLASGAICGALSWYLAIAGLTVMASQRIGQLMTKRLDLLSGLALVGFGCALMAQSV